MNAKGPDKKTSNLNGFCQKVSTHMQQRGRKHGDGIGMMMISFFGKQVFVCGSDFSCEFFSNIIRAIKVIRNYVLFAS